MSNGVIAIGKTIFATQTIYVSNPAEEPNPDPEPPTCLEKLNSATYADFDAVYGIGDVDDVNGIGPVKMKAILDYPCAVQVPPNDPEPTPAAAFEITEWTQNYYESL